LTQGQTGLARTREQLLVDDQRIVLAKPVRRPYVWLTALFSVGLSCLVYAISSHFGAPNMKSIPVRTGRIAGLQGE
jgi:hypothetical protein